MEIITDSAALHNLCKELAAEDYITVDTEFIRERTYWAKLCLIQVAGINRAVIIDPLAEGINLQPFFDLLVDERVLKVMHAGRQDVEIFHHLTGQIPRPLFDTQIAAMVCGFGDQVSYGALVERLTGARLDKASRFTDWARRPLSKRQLEYALADVTHLREAYEKLREELRHSGREHWLKEELAILTSPETYEQDVEEAFRRIKFRPRDARQLALLQRLARWREEQAQRRDLPRRRVLKDEAIVEIASEMPRDEKALASLRNFPADQARKGTGREILQLVEEVLDLPKDELPQLPKREKPHPQGTQARAEILKLALKIVCERENIAPKLIASAADLEKLAAGREDLPVLMGWRREVFGDMALALLRGEKVIGLQDGRPAILPACEH